MRERVITVHGIWTEGPWQEELARVFAPHFECIAVKYRHYRVLGPLNLVLEPYVLVVLGLLVVLGPSVLTLYGWHASDWAWYVLIPSFLVVAYLATYLRRTLAFHTVLRNMGCYPLRPYPHLIAHSLGTYFIGRALRTRSDFHLGRIILVGCVLPRRFPWPSLLGVGVTETYKYLEVRNDLARRDIVVCIAWLMSWLIRGLGVSGFSGFKGSTTEIHKVQDPGRPCTTCPTHTALVHNVVSKYLGHSSTFVGSGYAETFWLPFLWGIEPAEYQDFLLYCNMAGTVEREWSAAARASGHVDPRLLEIEKKLLLKTWRWTGGTFGSYVEQEVLSRFPKSGTALDVSVSIAVRGTWQSIELALEARQAREDRVRCGLTADPLADNSIAWLNPREAVCRAVALLL